MESYESCAPGTMKLKDGDVVSDDLVLLHSHGLAFISVVILMTMQDLWR